MITSAGIFPIRVNPHARLLAVSYSYPILYSDVVSHLDILSTIDPSFLFLQATPYYCLKYS